MSVIHVGHIRSNILARFVPLSAALVLAWWLTTFRRNTSRRSQLAFAGAMIAVAFTTLTLLMAHVAPGSTPVTFAASRWAQSGSGFLYLSGLARCLLAREFLYTFAWLLPLGLLCISQLPKPWVVGSVCAGITALLMGAYDDALGNATRAIFSAVGPLLSLSVAVFLIPKCREGGDTRALRGDSVASRDLTAGRRA